MSSFAEVYMSSVHGDSYVGSYNQGDLHRIIDEYSFFILGRIFGYHTLTDEQKVITTDLLLNMISGYEANYQVAIRLVIVSNISVENTKCKQG